MIQPGDEAGAHSAPSVIGTPAAPTSIQQVGHSRTPCRWHQRIKTYSAHTRDQYIPGAPSDENVRVGEQAVTNFQDVLAHDANNISAIDGLGSIIFQMAGTPFQPERFMESKKYHQKHVSLNPNDADPYYWVGVINWTLARRANDDWRSAYNVEHRKKRIQHPDPLPDKLRAQFTEQQGALIDEAMQMLDKAVQIRPEYADAIAYKSLVLRMKADMAGASEPAALEKRADDLLEQVKSIKSKEAAEKAAKG